MENLPTVVSLVDCTNEEVSLVPENMTITVTEDNGGAPCAYIIHVPVGADTSLLTETVSNILVDIKPSMEAEIEQVHNPVGNIEASSGTEMKPEVALMSTQIMATNLFTENEHKSEATFETDENDNGTKTTSEDEVETKIEISHLPVNELSNIPSPELNKLPKPNLCATSIHQDPSVKKENTVEVLAKTEIVYSEDRDIKVSEVFAASVTKTSPSRNYGKISKVPKNAESSGKISESRTTSTRSESQFSKNIIYHEIQISQPQPISLQFARRKRRLIIDSQKQIPIGEFKKQLGNTKDIVQEKAEIAPASKKAMKTLEAGNVGKIFCTPGRPLKHMRLYRLFYNRLVIAPETENYPVTTIGPLSADLRIPEAVSCDEIDETSDPTCSTSDFVQLRDKLNSNNGNMQSPKPKITYRGVKDNKHHKVVLCRMINRAMLFSQADKRE